MNLYLQKDAIYLQRYAMLSDRPITLGGILLQIVRDS